MPRVQIITIIISLLLLLLITRLILKGKLREEYAIVWIISTFILIVFSIWKEGLVILGKFMQVYDPPNLIFTGAIAAILIYLLHLSVIVSKLQDQNKKITQENALLKEKIDRKESDNK